MGISQKVYTEKDKREKIEELRKAREQRNNDLMTQMYNKYTKSEMALISKWEMADRKGEPIHKEYTKKCPFCNKVFVTTKNLQVACDECKGKHDKKKTDKAKKIKPASICFNCVNYQACGKMREPLKVQKRMKKYETIMFSSPTSYIYNEPCLKVYKCDGYITKMDLTAQQIKDKAKALINGKPIFFKRGGK